MVGVPAPEIFAPIAVRHAARSATSGSQAALGYVLANPDVSAAIFGATRPAHLRENVFERFVRLDEGTHGSGLGLAIVRDITNLHGAELTLADAAGGGAVFTVVFP